MKQAEIDQLLFIDPFDPLPEFPREQREKPNVPHAPTRAVPLNEREKKLAVYNALRYVPSDYHVALAKEFAAELKEFGHIYALRFMPNFDLKAPPIAQIKAKCQSAAAIILMILNNLDAEVAQFPQELVTYGGNGQVFSNWIQFRLVLRYLSQMTSEQTLAIYSGHPLGLFPSPISAPRVVITNGMV